MYKIEIITLGIAGSGRKSKRLIPLTCYLSSVGRKEAASLFMILVDTRDLWD